MIFLLFYLKSTCCKKKISVSLLWSSWKAWLLILIFFIHSPFLLPSFFRGKRKGEENNQSFGQKSCLSARSVVIKYNCTSKWWKLFGSHIALAQERGQLCTQNAIVLLYWKYQSIHLTICTVLRSKKDHYFYNICILKETITFIHFQMIHLMIYHERVVLFVSYIKQWINI